MAKNYKLKDETWKSKGFTMFELLVILFIVILLSVVLLVNYRGSEKRFALSQDMQKLISKLRQAQNMAMSGSGIYGQYYGYGIYAEEGNGFYVLYGDENGNDEYDDSDEDIEKVYLSSRIKIQSVSPLPPKVNIFFKPPNPTTFIDGNSGSDISGSITLGVEGTSLTKTVLINTAGLIQ